MVVICQAHIGVLTLRPELLRHDNSLDVDGINFLMHRQPSPVLKQLGIFLLAVLSYLFLMATLAAHYLFYSMFYRIMYANSVCMKYSVLSYTVLEDTLIVLLVHVVFHKILFWSISLVIYWF